MKQARYLINYRQKSLLSSTTHVLECANSEERDIYTALVQEDASITEALLIDKAKVLRNTTRIK